MEAGGLQHVVVAQGATRRLVQRAGFVREADLQLLVKESPELLGPLGQDLTFVPIGWEVALGPGYLDLLFLDSEGTLTLVETKLRANNESRREVIGQVLEYAAYAAEWTLDDVRRAADGFFASPQAPGDLAGASLDEALAIRFGWVGDDEDEQAAKLGHVLELTARKLQAGQLRVVCGVDERIENLERLVRYLSQHSDLQVVLLQVNRFPADDDLMVLVPSLHGDIDTPPARRAGTSAATLTVQEIIEAYPEGKARDAVAAIVAAARSAGASLACGPSGMSVRVRCALKPDLVTVAWIFAPGKQGWMRTRDISFGHALDYPGINPELVTIVERYYQEMLADGLGGDASSKGVHARWLTGDEANDSLNRLIPRFERVIREIGAISPGSAV